MRATRWHAGRKEGRRMPTKRKLLPLILLLSPFTALAAVYIEPRLSVMHAAEISNVSDIGTIERPDRNKVIPGIALGCEISPRVRVELRYTSIGSSKFHQIYPTWQLLGGAILPPTYPIAYARKTQLYSFAVPVRVAERGAFTLWLAPIVHLEHTHTTLAGTVFHPLPEVTRPAVFPPVVIDPIREFVPVRFYDKARNSYHAGGELSAHYRLNPHTALTASYTYAPLGQFKAHLFGGGVEIKF